jgi:hypothetical protein
MKKVKIIILIIGFFISFVSLIAQGPSAPPDFSYPPDPPANGPCAPIDGGLSILIILSLGYGAGKIYRLKKPRQVKD